jgi:hypothetical protein
MPSVKILKVYENSDENIKLIATGTVKVCYDMSLSLNQELITPVLFLEKGLAKGDDYWNEMLLFLTTKAEDIYIKTGLHVRVASQVLGKYSDNDPCFISTGGHKVLGVNPTEYWESLFGFRPSGKGYVRGKYFS